MQLRISDDDLTYFVSFLALGALHAFRSGAPPASGALATLSHPDFWDPIAGETKVSQEWLGTIQGLDEIYMVPDDMPELAYQVLARSIERLQAELREGPRDQLLDIQWVSDSS